MSKEAWKTTGKVALATATGVAEGALIAIPFSITGGPIAGGIIGGATALSAELIGRIPKRNVEVSQAMNQTFAHAQDDTVGVTTAETKAKSDVPLIEVPDTIARLHSEVMADIIGDITAWQFDTTIARPDNTRPPRKYTKTLDFT